MFLTVLTVPLPTVISELRKHLICTINPEATCALRTALSRSDNWPGTGDPWADQRNAGDAASDASAALAGFGGGCEGVSVLVNVTLIQTGITDGAAGI